MAGVLIVFSFAASERTATQELPPVVEIFQKMQDHWQPIHDYTVNARIVVNIPGIRMPRMKVKIYFKKPNLYHFEAKGFALLPKEGLGVPPDRLEKWKKNARLIGRDTLNHEPVYHFLVDSRPSEASPFQTHLYVDQKNFLLVRLKTNDSAGNYMQITFHYKKLTPNIWLPNKIISHFEINAMRQDSTAEKFRTKMMNGRTLFKPSFKKGTVYVYLKDYKLNTGLSDAIFNRKSYKTVPALQKNETEK